MKSSTFIEEGQQKPLIPGNIKSSGRNMTPSTLSGSAQIDDDSILPIHKDLRKLREGAIKTAVEKKSESALKNDTSRIPREERKKLETTTPVIVSNRGSELTREDSKIIQPEDLLEVSNRIKEASLGSMNLLGDSAKHLFVLMKGLNPKDSLARAEEGIATLDIDRVRVAASCAREITNIVKTQVESLRLLRDLNRETK